MRSISIQYPLELPISDLPDSGQVAAIGDFDGIHLGHREVIRRAVETADKLGIPASIITFDPHPRHVLGQEKYGYHITPLADKLRLFAGLGISYTYVVKFDLMLSRISPSQFVEEMLIPLGIRTAVVGFDFSFGHRGAGNPDDLCRLASGRFAVEVVRPYHLDGIKVSSTAIRNHLAEGDVSKAASLLGRSYSMTGEVVRGQARGRQIGFPTANIAPDRTSVFPCNGVYAVRLKLDGTIYSGVANVGVKPTFEGETTTPTIEAHLFDFADFIYGRQVELEFVRRIRPERKFDSIDDLVRQIHQDADEARRIHLTMA